MTQCKRHPPLSRQSASQVLIWVFRFVVFWFWNLDSWSNAKNFGWFFLDLGLWVARFVVVMMTLVVDFLGPLPPTAMGLCLDWHFGVWLLQLVPSTCYICICVCFDRWEWNFVLFSEFGWLVVVQRLCAAVLAFDGFYEIWNFLKFIIIIIYLFIFTVKQTLENNFHNIFM